MNDFDTRGRLVAQAFFSELEKIAADAMSADPQAGLLAGGVQDEAASNGQQGPEEVIQNEAAPAHGVVASRITQLDPRRAVGIPVLQPPPGYTYNPDLASFVPNEQDPGWMEQQKAIEAARNKGWYDQGQQDVVAGQAQEQLDAKADADVQQASAESQQQQQHAMMQQAAAQQGMMAEAKEVGKNRADMAAGVVPRPAAKSPASKSKSKSSGKEQKGSGKSVTIHLGR